MLPGLLLGFREEILMRVSLRAHRGRLRSLFEFPGEREGQMSERQVRGGERDGQVGERKGWVREMMSARSVAVVLW